LFLDLRLSLFLLPQCPQHTVGQDQSLDVRVRGDLSDHGRWHVQAPFNSGSALGHGVVSDEEIRFLRQSHKTFTIAVGISAEDDHLVICFYAPRQRREIGAVIT